MIQRTYYYTLRRLIHKLAVFMVKRQAVLFALTGIEGTQYATDFNDLRDLVVRLDRTWPPYIEVR
jgi:hypothetical protein